MTTSIYDDPQVLAKPSSDEVRIADLQAVVASESDIRSVATLVQESLQQAEKALQDKRVVIQRAADRELSPFVAAVNRLHAEAGPLREQLAQIGLAKAELLELSPIGKKIAQLQYKLLEITTLRSKGPGTPNQSDPIRPVMVERIAYLDATDQIALASAERRKLKRLDDDVAEIQAEIATLKAKIGIAS